METRPLSALTQRHAGVLLHPTSLPGPYGIGDLGPSLTRFLDWMADAGFGLWQILPLGPTGYGDSPYQCFSAFAGNPYLIAPDLLLNEGLVSRRDLRGARSLPAEGIDYGAVIEWKNEMLRAAFDAFEAGGGSPGLRRRYSTWRGRKGVREWLDSYALFMALKQAHGGAVWNEWPTPLRKCEPRALARARSDHSGEIEFQTFVQFLFFDQWDGVREQCRARGISIVGDMPIYVAFDSADTWANQGLFKLTAEGRPTHVAGVPPDYFSATGQLWGNPIYRYDRMKRDGFAWWVRRVGAMMETVDLLRLDHFRGFEAYWEVPAGEQTAVNGRWVPGPREALFEALEKAHGALPIIAENLGVITPEVEQLRERFKLPGMKVLQFGWGIVGERPMVPDPDNAFHPHKIDPDSVVYTGTHDNPTTLQWWREFATPAEKRFLRAYLGTEGSAVHDDLTRTAFASAARTAIVPMQDLLGLGAEGRMNFPGRPSGNWCWRMGRGAASQALGKRLRNWLLMYDRHKDQHRIAQERLEAQSAEARSRKP